MADGERIDMEIGARRSAVRLSWQRRRTDLVGSHDLLEARQLLSPRTQLIEGQVDERGDLPAPAVVTVRPERVNLVLGTHLGRRRNG